MIKNKKGFTLIELIVVIAIIGILVLLATPKFLGYVDKTQLARIRHDIKVAENISDVEITVNAKYPDTWEDVDYDELTELSKKNKTYDIRGLLKDRVIDNGEYVMLAKGASRSRLKGNFYANQGGTVYYVSDKSFSAEDDSNPEGKPDKSKLIKKKEEADKLNPDDYEDFTEVEKAVKKATEIIDIEDDKVTQEEIDEVKKKLEDAMKDLIEKPGLPGTKDTDFKWIRDDWYTSCYDYGDGSCEKSRAERIANAMKAANGEGEGYYKYIGLDEIVVIPDKINGQPITSYYRMFEGSKANIKKVVSNNKNVTKMSRTFESIDTTELDLSDFDTSNVTDMSHMFERSSSLTSINLSNFDTSNVTTMSGMFYDSSATEIIFGNKFHTTKVADMSYMFQFSKVNELDLSSFDTSSVTNMEDMFLVADISKAYARNAEEVKRLNNATGYKPKFTFELK